MIRPFCHLDELFILECWCSLFRGRQLSRPSRNRHEAPPPRAARGLRRAPAALSAAAPPSSAGSSTAVGAGVLKEAPRLAFPAQDGHPSPAARTGSRNLRSRRHVPEPVLAASRGHDYGACVRGFPHGAASGR